MKKTWLFTFSILMAMAITFYIKRPGSLSEGSKIGWKTYEKKKDKSITAHKSTTHELEAARVSTKREIAQVNDEDSGEGNLRAPASSRFLYRENRVLTGEIQKKNYTDLNTELVMSNKLNPNWKEILGHDLIRFHENEAKVMIKEEFPVIKVQDGKGTYCEQVIITYLSNNKIASSYRALIDSETGLILETWDKTVHENNERVPTSFTLPENDSGITSH